MNVVDLTKKLISIPSYVGEKSDEVAVAEYIESFVKTNIPNIPLGRQYLPGSPRFNLVSIPKSAKILVVGHLDTVPPQASWKNNPFVPRIIENRIIGLGSADMKGSQAAFLSALVSTYTQINLEKLALLLYCDEEYKFQGMKTFIKSLSPSTINPDLILSLDGRPIIESGCRGLIEISGFAKGQSGPAAKPFLGVNAIKQFVISVNSLETYLNGFFDGRLGPTTSNLAYLRGGNLVENNNEVLSFSQIGNIIPDFVEFLIEIRTSTPKLNAKVVTRQLRRICRINNIRLEKLKTIFDYSPWLPDSNSKLQALTNAPPSTSTGTFFSGFIDTALLNQIFPNTPKFVYGAGGTGQHSAGESVSLDDLKTASINYQKILLTYCCK